MRIIMRCILIVNISPLLGWGYRRLIYKMLVQVGNTLFSSDLSFAIDFFNAIKLRIHQCCMLLAVVSVQALILMPTNFVV